MQCILDTSKGPNLIREDYLETDWLQNLPAVSAPSAQSATNEKVSIFRTVLFHVRMADAGIPVVFGVVGSRAVLILLGTSFIDRYVKGIFLPEHKILLHNSATVAVVTTVVET